MKTDLKKDRRELYQPGSADFTDVVVPPMTYLAVDGHGDPNTSPAYAAAVEALFTTAYATKFVYKARSGDDFVVGPLEGLWSSADPGEFTRRNKDAWDWTMLIPLPDQVDAHDIAAGLAKAALKKPALPAVRVMTLDEGLCLQILHLGSFDSEAETLARLHDQVMPERGLTFNGRHHEIYLSDPRKTPPERLRTVLRQPVRPATSGGPDGDR